MAENVLTITDGNFEELVLNSEHPVLVDFWAPWCGPCVAIGPVIESLATEFQGKVAVGKMNVDENAKVPASYGVRFIPYIAVFKGGKLVDSVVGVVPKTKLTDMMQKTL